MERSYCVTMETGGSANLRRCLQELAHFSEELGTTCSANPVVESPCETSGSLISFRFTNEAARDTFLSELENLIPGNSDKPGHPRLSRAA